MTLSTTATEMPVAKTERRRAHAAIPESVDVAIIGAGLGGLTAGAYLARQGLTVALFEQHYVAGGCATHFERGPKRARYHFDVGLHYIGDCGPDGAIPRMLRSVGIELAYAELDPDGFDTLLFPDLEFRIPVGVERYRDRLRSAFPSEKRAIDRYVKALAAVMKATRLLDARDGRMSLKIALSLAMDMLPPGGAGREDHRPGARLVRRARSEAARGAPRAERRLRAPAESGLGVPAPRAGGALLPRRVLPRGGRADDRRSTRGDDRGGRREHPSPARGGEDRGRRRLARHGRAPRAARGGGLRARCARASSSPTQTSR